MKKQREVGSSTSNLQQQRRIKVQTANTHLVLSNVINFTRGTIEFTKAFILGAAIHDALGKWTVEIIIIIGIPLRDASLNGEQRSIQGITRPIRGGYIVTYRIELGGTVVRRAARGSTCA